MKKKTQNKKEKDPNRLVTPDGGFKSEFPGGVGQGYSIGYLEDLCEWIYCHDSLTDKEKMERILPVEKMIEKHLQGFSKYKINYMPTWSTKLEEKKEKMKKSLLSLIVLVVLLFNSCSDYDKKQLKVSTMNCATQKWDTIEIYVNPKNLYISNYKQAVPTLEGGFTIFKYNVCEFRVIQN